MAISLNMTEQDFVVIDTEGKDELSEIAILDSQGKLIYEAFTEGHPNNTAIRVKRKNLRRIVQEFAEIAQSKTVVCHSVKHDRRVLENSFLKAGVRWQPFLFECSYELARQCFPSLPEHSLGYLSKHLKIRVEDKTFNTSHAHTARYDAEFTYRLYLELRESLAMHELLQNTPNPFSSSHVDTPFQDHLDLSGVYRAEYETLKSIIDEIKRDPNQQSRGAVVIGEPGAGKTHLMMRLAKERLKTNRLLFIRQPNNPDAVLHHTYARILESFAERIPDTQHDQLEQLVANSFISILKSIERVTTTQTGTRLLSALEQNSLSLYSGIGSEGTQRNRQSWQYIENHITDWWKNRYTAAGYSPAILQGILRFCSYIDPRKKDVVRRWLAASEIPDEQAADIGLENWQGEISKEEFSLQAIATFGKLSTHDEPLIIVFDQLEGLSHKPTLLDNFGDAIKEILTHVPNSLIILNLFPDRWEQFQKNFDSAVVGRVSQHQVYLNRPSNEKLRDILSLKAQSLGLDLDQLFNRNELDDILSQNSIRAILNRAAEYYRYKANGIPLPKVEPKHVKNTTIEAIILRIENEFDALKKAISDIPPSIEIVADYLLKKREELEQNYDVHQIVGDSDDIGKLAEIIGAFQTLQQIDIGQMRLGRKILPDHLKLRISDRTFVIGFLHVSGNSFVNRIKNFNQLVIDNPKTQFRLIRDSREPQVKGDTSKHEIERLNRMQNGSFAIMDKADRIRFELAYNLIVGIQNRDLETNLATAIPILANQLGDYWITNILFCNVDA
jgi:Cdc6-like AAA superfamily ATPase